MIRVFVLYEQAPDLERYAQHVELNRREVPEATIRHGRILGSPQGDPEHRYYFEYEFADRDAWKRSQQGLMNAAEDAQKLGIPFKVFFAELG
jgi:hypothetical protein